MHVCAVTVAYDNPEDLARLLRSLPTQSRLSGLIVLDNSRTEYLEDNEAAFRAHAGQYEFARYICPHENVGSAGGFCIGMKTAHEQGFDWVWLLDQDGTVQSGCLASLLRNAGRADILCPQIVDIGDPSVVLPQSGGIQNFWGRIVWQPFTESRDISFFGTHGALVSKKVLDRIGYYDPRYFFVGSEDSDYAFRSTKEDMIIRLVSEAEARHPDIFCRSTEKRNRLFNEGLIDSVSSEQATSFRGAHLALFSRLTLLTSEPLNWLLPEHLGYMSSKLMDDRACRKSRALASLSYAYLATKRLNTLQLVAAVCYSTLIASFRKILSGDRISLKKTVAMYAICMRSKLTRKWPFESVEQFCSGLSS